MTEPADQSPDMTTQGPSQTGSELTLVQDTGQNKTSEISSAKDETLAGDTPAISDSENTTPPAENSLQKALNDFLVAIDDYRDTVGVAIPLVRQKQIADLTNALETLLAFRGQDPNGETAFVAKGVHAASDMLKAMRRAQRLMGSKILDAMARSFFIGLFSEYDAFIGSLLQIIYARKPELYRTIKREIALTDLIEFEDLESVKRDMLEKEIDSIRRQSYVEQFATLERTFDLTLRAFQEWPAFVEIGQRRNLMTHNDGQVSQQYLVICEREGFQFDPRPALRTKLTLTRDYLINSINVVSKVAFMLTHTLWRKLFPDDCKLADKELNNTLYDLLHRSEWKSAVDFGMFGLQKPMLVQTEDIMRRTR